MVKREINFIQSNRLLTVLVVTEYSKFHLNSVLSITKTCSLEKFSSPAKFFPAPAILLFIFHHRSSGSIGILSLPSFSYSTSAFHSLGRSPCSRPLCLCDSRRSSGFLRGLSFVWSMIQIRTNCHIWCLCFSYPWVCFASLIEKHILDVYFVQGILPSMKIITGQ